MKIAAIEMDASIQCRAVIDTATITDYAERMTEGDTFPPVVLFGTEERCWIGDGWHRVLAAKQVGFTEIGAEIQPGGRAEALRYALGANAANGLRRTNADKRRCVEIALAEFGGMSDNAIAQMCGVSNHAVKAARPVTLENIQPDTRTGTDGKQYPAARKPKAPATPEEEEKHYEEQNKMKGEKPKLTKRQVAELPPCRGMFQADRAIWALEIIEENDTQRTEAFAKVKGWIKDHE